MKKNLGNLEQFMTFLGIILICSAAMIMRSPKLFIPVFLGGIGYHVVRGKKKGWKLPNGVKNSHSW